VADVVAGHRAFPTDFAALCHPKQTFPMKTGAPLGATSLD
jgi:hypothetical protein